jgi:4-aminobutyrate aminotransferase/(S)-3-amino-2-methylpropionate transaminase
MFVSEYYKEAGCAPDIMTTAKSIAGGIPLSAIVARDEVMEGVHPGTIGGTYGANALAAVSALKVIEVMERDNFPAKALHIADVLTTGFKEMQKKYPCIGDVRGTGAMMGIEFVKDPETKTPDAEIVGKIIQNAMNKGLMLEGAGTYNNVIRILCPLVATDEQLEAGLKIFEEALAEAAK